MKCKFRMLCALLALLLLCGNVLPVLGDAAADFRLYECETQLGESAHASAKDAEGASGGQTVGPLGMNGAAWFVMAGVEAPSDGDYKVEVDYTGCADGRTFRIGVNGADGKLVQAPDLPGWTDFGTTTVTLSLQAGENTLKFYSVDAAQGLGDSEWGPDIDCVRVANQPTPFPEPTDGYWKYECETHFAAAASAYAGVKDAEGASGGQTVGPLGMNGAAWCTMTGVAVPADGEYKVEVDYTSCADGRTFRIGVNGADGELVQAPALPGWTDIGTATMVLSLEKGENALKFYSVDTAQGLGDSEWGPDIDCVRVYAQAQQPTPFPEPVDGCWKYECETQLGETAYAAAKDSEGASGGQTVGPLGMNGAAWFTMTGVAVPADGEYKVEVDYTSCADGRTFRVGVNGADGELVQAPALPGWTDIGTATLVLSLKKGDNTLKFYSVEAAQGLGDTEWGPDIDCVRVCVPNEDQRDIDISAAIALIDSIGTVNQENYAQCLESIEKAEAALRDLVTNYGENVRAEVTNGAILTEARNQYNLCYYTATLPALTDGYRLYECESETSVLTNSAASEQETASGGQKVGPIGQNGNSSCEIRGIIVPQDGIYRIEVFYTTTVEISGRTFRVGVNGQPGELVIAAGMESYESIGIIALAVPLKAGINSLLFYGMDTALNLGDTMWGPDLDCVRVYEDSSAVREQAVKEVIDLINAIDEVNEENYSQCLVDIRAAESAMKRLEVLYGEKVRSEVTNYEALLTAREDYDFYSQPIVRDGFVVYECENTSHTQLNGAGIGQSASGAGVVNSIAPGAATSFTMSIEAAETGWYDLQIGYFNGESEARLCCMEINGRSMGLRFDGTGSWEIPGQILLTVQLEQGVNRFVFCTAADSEGFGPDFDYLGVSETPVAAPVPAGERIGAQSAVLTGSLTLTDDAYAFDGKRITGFATAQDKACFSFTAASDGIYWLGVEASSAQREDQVLNLALRGSDQVLPDLTLSSGYSVSAFGWMTTGLELAAGEYTLEISCLTSGVSDDCVAISSITLAELTGGELMNYRANEIGKAIQNVGLISAGNYAERTAVVDSIIADLQTFDADYGEDGAALVSSALRGTLSNAQAACRQYAEAKEKASEVEQSITAIGSITKDNYQEKASVLETAEKAMNDYLAAYGNDCKAFVSNHADLAQARADYDRLSSYTLGDINDDGSIDASDALLALQHSVRLITLEDAKALAADVNHDGQIDASDALLILQYSVNLITQFPNA